MLFQSSHTQNVYNVHMPQVPPLCSPATARALTSRSRYASSLSVTQLSRAPSIKYRRMVCNSMANVSVQFSHRAFGNCYWESLRPVLNNGRKVSVDTRESDDSDRITCLLIKNMHHLYFPFYLSWNSSYNPYCGK